MTWRWPWQRRSSRAMVDAHNAKTEAARHLVDAKDAERREQEKLTEIQAVTRSLAQVRKHDNLADAMRAAFGGH